jgi:hypothetical protein
VGPFWAFTIVWAVVIVLHALKVLFFYAPFSVETTMSSAAIPIVAWVIFRCCFPRARPIDLSEIRARVARAELFRDWVAIAALAIFVFELLFFGGLPVWWMINGEARGYADFGIPTLHGIFNALLLFVTSAAGIFIIIGPHKWKNAAIMVAGLLVMIALYSRAMLVISLIQIGGIFLLHLRSRLSPLRVLGFVVLTIVGLFGFGVFGNLRSAHQIAAPEVFEIAEDVEWRAPSYASSAVTSGDGLLDLTNVGYNPFIGLINSDRAAIFKVLPTEFLWAYSYITSGYNNLLFNLNEVAPSYSPDTTFSKLLPTVAYTAIGREKEVDTFERAHPAFTVSTAFAGPVSDFGYFGFLFAIPLLVGGAAAYQRAVGGSPRATLLYAMLFQSILLTPYVDTVLYTTFVLQMLLALMAGVDFGRVWRREKALISTEGGTPS